MIDETLKALIASGPLALVLGIAVKILWTRLAEVEGKRIEEHRACLEREDKVRDQLESKLQKEREDYKLLLLDLNTTLKGLLETQED